MGVHVQHTCASLYSYDAHNSYLHGHVAFQCLSGALCGNAPAHVYTEPYKDSEWIEEVRSYAVEIIFYTLVLHKLTVTKCLCRPANRQTIQNGVAILGGITLTHIENGLLRSLPSHLHYKHFSG